MRNLLLRFVVRPLCKEHGAITVMFAIMFPLLIMFYSVAYDGARFQSNRARLADGLNQGVLAVAMVDNRNATSADETANITLLHNYLSYYLPNATIADSDLDIAVALNYSSLGTVTFVDYIGSGKISVQTIIGAQKEVGFDSAVDIQADSHEGVVRKTVYATDYAFVLDFSGSMLSASAVSDLTSIQLLRKAVAEFMDEVLYDDSSDTVGIIPFVVDVPVILPGTNIAGGNNFGCTAAGKLKADYENVDFDFWYNKIVQPVSPPVAANWLASFFDGALYNYYQNVVSPATGYSIDDMVNKGWCVKNSSWSDAEYSCDADPRSRLSDNYTEALETSVPAHQLMLDVWSDTALFNTKTMDFDGLFADGFMFSDEAVKTWNYLVNKAPAGQPFFYSCISAFGSITQTTASEILKDPTAKPASYLIELTNDRSIIDEFNDMRVAASNYYSMTASGLLRALPLIAKGVNQRKIIIVISDGHDLGSTLTKTLFQDYLLCDKIKEGLLRYPAGTTTEQVDMYYILTANNSSASNLWSNYCVGADHVYQATTYQDMMNTLTGIYKKAPVNFINKDE